MVVPYGDPKNIIAVDKTLEKSLFGKYPKALLIRYTSDFDKYDESQWYYCIKDDAYSFETLKSKRKNVIRKALNNFDVLYVNPAEHVEEMQEIINDANKGYQYQIAFQEYDVVKNKCKALSSRPETKILGAFSKENGAMVGYLWIDFRGKCISMVEQHCIRAYEKKECNAALVNKLCEIFNSEYLECGYYICDGEKNILHETNFQQYLAKYFGFRKAYCRLNVVYRMPVNLGIKILYPLWKGLKLGEVKSQNRLVNSFNAIMQTEQIVRTQGNEKV